MSLTLNNREKKMNALLEYIWQLSVENKNKKFCLKAISQILGVSATSVYRYLETLLKEGVIEKNEKFKQMYFVKDIDYSFKFSKPFFSEDVVWSRNISPCLPKEFSQQAYRNLHYVFTEMFNNAIDHSEGDTIKVQIGVNRFRVILEIEDNGVGVFKKISKSLGLEEERFAILELSKGKFTTEPDSHTGEGIFFSSKISDVFFITSDNLTFCGGTENDHDLIMDSEGINDSGTSVFMMVKNETKISCEKVFNKFTNAPNDYGFKKTIVSVKLLESGDPMPMFNSRSQAKRLLLRLDRFENIVLDFKGVKTIGQGFADEIFRVFKNENPNSAITYMNENKAVENMIKHVISTNK